MPFPLFTIFALPLTDSRAFRAADYWFNDYKKVTPELDGMTIVESRTFKPIQQFAGVHQCLKCSYHSAGSELEMCLCDALSHKKLLVLVIL